MITQLLSMIAQVLNRAVVLDNARTLQEALSRLVTDFDDPAVRSGVALGLEREDLDAALAMTDENVKREESESSGQRSFPALDTERRGSTVAPLDDFSFFSRD